MLKFLHIQQIGLPIQQLPPPIQMMGGRVSRQSLTLMYRPAHLPLGWVTPVLDR